MKYEDKMRMMQWVKPEKKDELLLRLVRGETVDITKDADLFYQVNRERMSLDAQMQRDKYQDLANHMKDARDVMNEGGWTANKHWKYLGDIPPEIYYTHPMFSPNLPRNEKSKNVRQFFKDFPQFRGSK